MNTEEQREVMCRRVILIIITIVLPTLIYLAYIIGIFSSLESIETITDFMNEGKSLKTKIYCILRHFLMKEKNTTKLSPKCTSYRRRLKTINENKMLKLNILNTSLDILSTETNVLLLGKVRYSDYIWLPDLNLGDNMLRYIGQNSLQWIQCINEREIKEFRESDDYVLLPFYNGKLGPEYTDLLQVQPFPFLRDLKNPCWKDSRYGLLCLPYMYLIGFPKSGTTDVYERIKTHPQFVPGRSKEPHWMTRGRFGARGGQSVGLWSHLRKQYSRVSSYISKHRKSKDNYPRVITGDFSASAGFDNDQWRLLPENMNRTEPLHTNADYIRHLYPETKIVAILRNPVDRLYSGYKYFNHGKCNRSPVNFHNNVVATVDAMYRCFSMHSIRRCAYDGRLHTGMSLRIWIGMYYISLLDYHRTFPKNQIFVFTTENYSKNTLTVTKDIFNFLELDPIKESVAKKIEEKRKSNVGGRHIGPMLNETRKILNDFYRPFNRLLANLLNDTSFNFDLKDN